MKRMIIYECPHCNKVYIKERDAYKCCIAQLNVYDGYICEDCGKVYIDAYDSWRCCLDYRNKL